VFDDYNLATFSRLLHRTAKLAFRFGSITRSKILCAARIYDKIMALNNRKTLLLAGSTSILASLCVVYSLFRLSALRWQDWLWCCVWLALCFVVSRLTDTARAQTDAARQIQKSLTATFVIAAAMMFGAGVAVVFAACSAFYVARHTLDRHQSIFIVSASTLAAFISANIYEQLAKLFLGSVSLTDGGGAALSILLIPLFVFALVRYGLCALAMNVYEAFAENKKPLNFKREELIWSLLMQVAGASAAGLFYAAWQGEGISFWLVGLLILALAHFLYHYNEQNVEEIKRAESLKLRHYEEISTLHINMIESLAIAIDAKDQTTHGHVRRTQIYAMELGRLLRVSESEMRALHAGALLHDVGKLAVPEHILNKPGKLTAAEFDKMKIHTIVGGDIVKRVKFPYPVEEVVRFHHEKWDGTGYPAGLRGEKIPMVARVLAVVDFYDATRCDRPYRKGMTREGSLDLLKKMAGTSFDPRVVDMFVKHIEEFDELIAKDDIQEQVMPEQMTDARPDAGLASDILGTAGGDSAFRSIAEAQREVFALHEIAQSIGASLNLNETVSLVTSKLRAIVPFDTCVIFLVNEQTGKAHAAHVAGDNAEIFANRRANIGEGITGWVIANARSMCNTSPELDLIGVPEEVAETIRGVLVSPLIYENGAFGAITLYSSSLSSYTSEHVRLLESVAQHASVAINNALRFERTKSSALTDTVTNLPNARAFRMSLEQRIAECRRLNDESLAVLSMDLDEFSKINDVHGHAAGDRLLASFAQIVKNQLRGMDVLARYAGDEFVAMMPMASSEVAEAVAARIRAAVESHKFTLRPGRTIETRISIGLACFPTDGETVDEIITCADRRMQDDKYMRRLNPTAGKASELAASFDAMR
jgi:diguanylate cyclase (GGDEF)-like protein/putative nucleotidyltransferase with HDIG domain